MKTPHPPWVAELRPYQPGKPIEELERELGITGAVKLASNENPRGPSPLAIEAMRRAVSQVHLYPDASAHYLRERLVEHLGVSASEIVVGNGSNELLTLLVRAFATPADHAVISEGAFIAYRVVLGAAGVPLTAVPMDGFTHDLSAMAAACTDQTRLLFVANPNNPTGTYNPVEDLRQLLRDTPEHVMVVLDEAYVEYIRATDYASALALRGERENLTITRTFSKAYGLAGARVGYGIVRPWVADLLGRIREPFNVNLVGQAGALAALDDVEFVAESAALNASQMAIVVRELDARGVETVPSQGNFVLMHALEGGAALYERLLREGVIVRPLASYGLDEHVRVTIGLPEENARFLESLDRCRAA